MTTGDYSIMVQGLPDDATQDEIRRHFSELFQLADPDWNFEGHLFGWFMKKDSRPPQDLEDSGDIQVRPVPCSLVSVLPGAAHRVKSHAHVALPRVHRTASSSCPKTQWTRVVPSPTCPTPRTHSTWARGSQRWQWPTRTVPACAHT